MNGEGANAVVYRGGGILPSVLPWYAVNEKNPADTVFTKQDIAADCYGTFRDVAKNNGYDLRAHVFLEPSAGEGCFLRLLPPTRSIALDIEPRNADIQRADFLEWSPPKTAKYAVIGNPPFGVRGAIALAFINRAAIFADIIGFILPMTFTSNGKGGAMTRVKGLHLLHSEELPPNAFYDADNGNEKDINTVFQVWGGRRTGRRIQPPPTCDSFIELYSVSTYHSRRCGLTRMDDYDFFIQGTFYDSRPPRIVKDFADVKYGSGYGVIVKKQKRAITEALRRTDWAKYSSRSTNHCRHIRMGFIRQAIMDNGFTDD